MYLYPSDHHPKSVWGLVVDVHACTTSGELRRLVACKQRRFSCCLHHSAGKRAASHAQDKLLDLIGALPMRYSTTPKSVYFLWLSHSMMSA